MLRAHVKHSACSTITTTTTTISTHLVSPSIPVYNSHIMLSNPPPSLFNLSLSLSPSSYLFLCRCTISLFYNILPFSFLCVNRVPLFWFSAAFVVTQKPPRKVVHAIRWINLVSRHSVSLSSIKMKKRGLLSHR